MTASAKGWLAKRLLGHAAGRLRRQRPDWADAMMRENSELASDDERLRWSSGCAYASYRTADAWDRIAYSAALMAGVALMSVYQWSADESLGTVAVICLIGFALGLLEPRRSLISGAAVGAVVAAVNGFETLTGLRPAYETRVHSLLHDARWTFLIAPALIACVIGSYVGRKLRSDSGARS
jgi:hypothetical protein